MGHLEAHLISREFTLRRFALVVPQGFLLPLGTSGIPTSHRCGLRRCIYSRTPGDLRLFARLRFAHGGVLGVGTLRLVNDYRDMWQRFHPCSPQCERHRLVAGAFVVDRDGLARHSASLTGHQFHTLLGIDVEPTCCVAFRHVEDVGHQALVALVRIGPAMTRFTASAWRRPIW